MTYPNGSTALASVVVDELCRGGVGLAAAGPGSRSTAVVLAMDARPDLEVVMCVDERSAAFHALGWSKATGRPTAVLTTSGTAVANLLPAVVEADLSGSQLLVVSADRPPESRGVGANQSIAQSRMFVEYVRATMELGPAEPHPSAPRWWRSTVSQALAFMAGFAGRPGPVHLNLSFREPTVPVVDDGRTRSEPYPYDQAGRADGRPWTESAWAPVPPEQVMERLVSAVERARRGLILAGGGTDGSMGVPRLGRHLGWPVLATAESGLRGTNGILSTGHHLVGRHAPDLIVRFGTPGPSRRMVDLVSSPIPQVVVGDMWSDPGRMADLLVGGDAEHISRALVERVEARPEESWGSWWRLTDQAVTLALGPELSSGLSEPSVAAATARLGADVMVVASSMPIRDVEMYAFDTPPIVANRGASGIDGFVSTALGASHPHRRSLALTGDLSLLHDSNGFIANPLPACVFVVVDNGGGGIFSFLPQADHADQEFERLFATPHGRDLGKLADLHGADCRPLEDVGGLPGAVEEAWEKGGVSILVASTDRAGNVAEHVRLASVAADAVAAVTPLEQR